MFQSAILILSCHLLGFLDAKVGDGVLGKMLPWLFSRICLTWMIHQVSEAHAHAEWGASNILRQVMTLPGECDSLGFFGGSIYEHAFLIHTIRLFPVSFISYSRYLDHASFPALSVTSRPT